MGVSDMQNEIVEQVKAAEARWNHKLNEIGNSKSTGQQARQQQQVVSEAVQSEINEQIERQKKEIDAYLDLIAAKVKAETQGSKKKEGERMEWKGDMVICIWTIGKIIILYFDCFRNERIQRRNLIDKIFSNQNN